MFIEVLAWRHGIILLEFEAVSKSMCNYWMEHSTKKKQQKSKQEIKKVSSSHLLKPSAPYSSGGRLQHHNQHPGICWAMKTHVCRIFRAAWGSVLAKRARLGWNGARVNGWLSWKSLTKSQPRRLRSWNTSGWNHGDAPKKMRWGDLMWPNPPKKPRVFHFFYGRTYRKPTSYYRNRKAMVPRHTGQSSSCSIIQEVPWRRQNGHEELLLLCNNVTFPLDMPSKLPSWKIAPQVSWPWWQNVTNIANCNVLSNDPLIGVSPWPRSLRTSETSKIQPIPSLKEP